MIEWSRPLRFCMVTTFYPPYNFGGDGIFVQRLSNELARRGHRVDVIHNIDAYRLPAGGDPPGRIMPACGSTACDPRRAG